LTVLEQHALAESASFVFAGVALIASLYTACLARLTRQRAFFAYAAHFASFGGFASIVSGRASSNRADESYVLAFASGALALVFALVAFRALPRARLLSLGWCSVASGLLVTSSCALSFVPASLLPVHAVQIGLFLQFALLASEIAAQLNAARNDLHAVREALSSELSAVSQALSTAEEASQRAERATRVRDEFIATMSHEFRTPLNPIINIPQGLRAEFTRVTQARCEKCQALFELEAGDVVANDTPCPDCGEQGTLQKDSALSFAGDAARARTLLGKVEHSGEHLLRVVNGILDYSKMEARQLKLLYERFDVRALLREVVNDLDEAAQRADIQLSMSFATGGDERPLLCFADPHRLREVLVQLIDNAIKFRRGASTVLVTLREQDGKLSFSVADQGIGIAKEHLDSIFTSFEQVSKGNTRSYGGTGLGLSMARSLVQMHGGEISASSEPDVGSTFRFWIPRGISQRGSLPEKRRLSVGARL
jgi:signal transduction histidine kinase